MSFSCEGIGELGGAPMKPKPTPSSGGLNSHTK